jgi:hypothetical protein
MNSEGHYSPVDEQNQASTTTPLCGASVTETF